MVVVDGKGIPLGNHLDWACQSELKLLAWGLSLIYKALVLTELRKGQLASLTMAQLKLDESPAYTILAAADEKNSPGSQIILRAGLVALLEPLGQGCVHHQLG